MNENPVTDKKRKDLAAVAQMVAQQHLVDAVLHDIQAGLQGLLTDAEVIAAELAKPKPRLTELRRDAADILVKIELLVATTNNLRDGSTFRSVKTFDLDSIIHDVLRLLDGRAKQRSVSIEYSNEVTDRPMVKVSPALAQQVVFNLIDNAIKFSIGRGGEPIVRLTLVRHGSYLEFRIQNVGPHLGPDEVGKVFQPFYRGALASAMATSGLGLGLPVAKSLLEEANGNVNLSSKQLEGDRALIDVVARFPDATASSPEPSKGTA